MLVAFLAALQVIGNIRDKKKSGEIKMKIKPNKSNKIGLYLMVFIDAIIIVQAVFSRVSLKERSVFWYSIVLLMFAFTIIAAFNSLIESYITDKGIYFGSFISWKEIVSYKFEFSTLYITFKNKAMFIKYNSVVSFEIQAQQRREVSQLMEEKVGVK